MSARPIAVRAMHDVTANARATNGHAANGNSNGVVADSDGAVPVEIVMRRMEDEGTARAVCLQGDGRSLRRGRISFFSKVVSGTLKTDATVQSFTRGEAERMTHLSIMQGRKPVEVQELHAGDLGAVAKLRITLTGDTLGAKGHEIFLEPVSMPEPAMTYAIEPKTRADEDKLAPALHKLMEEDQMVRFFRDPQTNEFLVAGAGQPHIEALVSKLKRRYHTEVTLKAPKVPYRETIRGKAEAQGRHKKQTRGHGPVRRLQDHHGAADARRWHRVCERYLRRCDSAAVHPGSPRKGNSVLRSAARGYLAGYPVVDFRISLVDGSYHDVDSSEMSFKMAARLAFRKCMELAKPTLPGSP